MTPLDVRRLAMELRDEFSRNPEGSLAAGRSCVQLARTPEGRRAAIELLGCGVSDHCQRAIVFGMSLASEDSRLLELDDLVDYMDLVDPLDGNILGTACVAARCAIVNGSFERAFTPMTFGRFVRLIGKVARLERPTLSFFLQDALPILELRPRGIASYDVDPDVVADVRQLLERRAAAGAPTRREVKELRTLQALLGEMERRIP